MLNPKFGFIGYREQGEPADAARHLYPCKACGQMVDKRDLAAVFHHEEPGHRPLPAKDARRVLWVSSMIRRDL